MTAQALRFEAAGHTYWLGERRVVNVTSVLDGFNVEMQEARRRSPEAFEFAQQLGTAVHVACALDDCGDLIESSVAEVVRPRLEAWRRFRAETGFVPELVEARVYHPGYMYAGTLDRVGMLNGCRTLIDLKTGVVSRFAALQTAGYKMAHEAMGGAPIERRMSLHLKDDGGYFVVPHKDRGDEATFLSMLTAFNWLKAKT